MSSEPTIDTNAPVAGGSEILIDAPRDTVWAVLAAINDWPSWNPDVKEASLEGPLSAGTQFRWKAGPGTITSTLQHVDRPHVIAWTGRTFEWMHSTCGASNRTMGRRVYRLRKRSTA